MRQLNLKQRVVYCALFTVLVMVLMVLPVTAATMVSIGNQYFQGGDYKGYQPAASKDLCISWCLNDELCTKLTYTDPNTNANPYPDGACWLKDDSALGPYPYKAGDHGESWIKQAVITRQISVATTRLVNAGPCDDGNPCTVNDYYSDGVCVAGTPLNCDDGDPNTKDTCDPRRGACIHTPVVGSPCDDGNACTVNDYYDQSGTCVAGTPKNCDDENPNTKDTCNPVRGACIHTPLVGSPCDDGNACTVNDYYDQSGTCVSGTPKNCDDGNPNTIDTCDPGRGACIHTAVTSGSCDDGNACTVNDYYDQSGTCVSGTPKNCDDGNPNTKDTCDRRTGACVHTSVTNGPCDDNNPCNKVFSSKDALTALQIAVGKLSYSADYDLNHDGKVDSEDAREILKIAVEGI
jgi:hypothetical protein